MSDFSVTHTIAAYGVRAYALAGAQAYGQEETGSFQPSSPAPTFGRTEDQVSLSPAGKELSARKEASASAEEKINPPENQSADDSGKISPSEGKGGDQQPVDEAEFRQIQQLKSRDAEVRAHEQAHIAAAGRYASGGPSFSYQTGADGKRYAVGGSVPIDIGKESTPAATIIKMRTVKRAALAPANPSAADRQIAAQAGMLEMRAMQELQSSQMTETQATSLEPAAPATNDLPENQSNRHEKNSSAKPAQEAPPAPSSSGKTPVAVTRKLMNDAYKTMASLA
jgi:hypothetical protein